jgi:mRNA-degrading endonuclease toxin of MazEF toxin-antitoxin module
VNQWDTWQWRFPHGDHPCVVISPPARCANPDCKTVNVIGCSSQRAARPALAHEVLLDSADGMDWPTLARCDVIYLAQKSELKRHRGSLCGERRRALGAKIIRLFGFWLD